MADTAVETLTLHQTVNRQVDTGTLHEMVRSANAGRGRCAGGKPIDALRNHALGS